MNTADRSMAFQAANDGYDVWCANLRGNKYSRNHERLCPDEDAKQFFDYSFAEMAIYDVTAMIDYVKYVTGAPKVAYIGHSMGTTIMFYLSVKNPEWVDRSVSVFVALAPVTLPVNSRCPLIKSLAPQIGLF